MRTFLCVLVSAGIQLIGPCAGQDKVATVPVFGVVRDVQGNPVAGAIVREVRRELDGSPATVADQLGLGVQYGASATTNSVGKFVLKAAAGGTFGIVAMRGTQERSQVVAPAAPAGQHQLTLHTLVRVRGRLIEIEGNGKDATERPATNRMVRSFGPAQSAIREFPNPEHALGVVETARTDRDGRFVVAMLKGEPCTIADQFGTCRLELPFGSKDEAVLPRKLRRVSSILANATTGQIVPGARLHLEGEGRPIGEDGVFAIDLPININAVIAAPGFAPCMISAGYNTSQIEMQPASNRRFTVTDMDGQAVAGRQLVSLEQAFSLVQSAPLVRRHTTDADGSFSMPRNERSSCSLWQLRDHRLIPLHVVPADDQQIEVRISTQTYPVHGTVWHADGTPAMHVPVYGTMSARSEPSKDVTPLSFTDHAGKFFVPALPGCDYQFHAQSVEATSTPVKVQPASGIAIRLELDVAR